MCNVDVPTVGIILGIGYSGGAIPLAAAISSWPSAMPSLTPFSRRAWRTLLRYNLSWQECAKLVGVSSYDLYAQGNIDGIIDYVQGRRRAAGEAPSVHRYRRRIH